MIPLAMLLSAVTARSDLTGWNIISEQDPGAALTHLKFIIRSGSLSDPVGKSGLAYFTARGILRGTQTRPYQDLNNAIESLGATISVSVDPTQTIFDATVLTSNLEDFLGIIRDLFTQPAFSVSDMNMLRKILFGELRVSLQDGHFVASRALMQAAYPGTALASPVEGTIASISGLTPQDARDFFAAHYTRENMIVGVTTSMDRNDLVSELETQLDSIPHGTLDLPELPRPVITGKGIQAVVVERDGLETVPVFIATNGVADSDPAILALEAGNFVFGGDTTSRLFQVLRGQNGWTYGVSSGYNQTLGPKSQPGLFSIYTFPSAQYFKPCLSQTLSMLRSYAKDGISAVELSRAQSALSNSYPFQLDTAESRLRWDLRSALTGRALLTSAQYSSAISQLSLTNLNSEIAAKTDVQDLLIVAVGSAASLQPILSALPDVKSVSVVQINP